MQSPDARGHLRLVVTPLHSQEVNVLDFMRLREELERRRAAQL
jgi:hypothetical protein